MLRPAGPPDACQFCATLFDEHARMAVALRHLVQAYHNEHRHYGQWSTCANPLCRKTRDVLDPPRLRK